VLGSTIQQYSYEEISSMTSQVIVGFHGTSSESAAQILANAYNESNKKNEWLGHGVYFFVEGVSDPLENATEWARANAWENGSYKYTNFAVIQSDIVIFEKKYIDLTNTIGLFRFNAFKEKFFNKIFTNFSISSAKIDEHNCMLFNFAMATLGIQAIKHNLYIKSVRERKFKLRLNVPNTTVLCVLKNNIESNSKIVKEGEIK
jgi:hypothetical protein